MRINRQWRPFHGFLFASTSAIAVAMPSYVYSQIIQCGFDYDVLPDTCIDANATSVVEMPSGRNAEPETAPIANSEGFVLAIDGRPIDADPGLEDQIRMTDLALYDADIRVTFDGLNADPRLDFEFLGDGNNRVQSRINYPAFTTRGEIRVINNRTGRIVSVVPISANGIATLPDFGAAKDLSAIYRVYDARGRYDETHPVRLDRSDDRGLAPNVEEGTDNTARRRIPIRGGAVTVSSNNALGTSTVRVLGETVTTDPDGNFAIRRILPPGTHDVDVTVSGFGNGAFTRRVDIPSSEWFYIGIADVTVGWRDNAPEGVESYYQTGRLVFTVDGVTASGVRITISADTREQPLSDLFRDIDRKDANSLAERIDPETGYQIFGDDSTLEDRTPTSGNLYARIEKDNNFILWGDFQGRLAGNSFLRNERTLYGAQVEWNSERQTGEGEPGSRLQLHAAQPDTLAGRDVFRGTGGSVYFLRNQDINIGSETVTVEIRDQITDRVVDRTVLQPGRDYTINYIQGTVLLTSPLSASAGTDSLVTTLPGGDESVNLVVNYEYTPTTGDVNGMNLGLRAEHWTTDRLRFGVSAARETTGTADQTSYGADIRHRIGEGGFLQLDYARSDGPGFGSSFSNDGGLIIDTSAANAGTGNALRAELYATFEDLGYQGDGELSFYAERRSEGFSSPDYSVTAATGAERLWGFTLEHNTSERLGWRIYHDDYANAVGEHDRETGAEIDYRLSERVQLAFGVEVVDRLRGTEDGSRTDLASRVTWLPRDGLEVYAFGQDTVSNSGLEDNARIGVGGSADINENWTLEAEVSDGALGFGARALAEYRATDNSSLYFGYELDPDPLVSGSQASEGRFISGGRRPINDQVEIFGENTYDLFGSGNSLTSAYGATYRPTQYTTYEFAYEGGRIDDETNGDFNRNAFSFGWTHQNDVLTLRTRAEYRTESGILDTAPRDADTVLLSFDSRYKFSEQARLQASLKYVDTQSDETSFVNGELFDARLGYAFRPIDNDRLNLLFQYRYLDDMIGQVVDGSEERAPQISQILSADATYEVNDHWTLGGKFGVRFAETAPDSTTPLTENNATLAVLNARYHLVHKWDILAEARLLDSDQAGRETGILGAAYRHFGNNVKLGAGYNFGQFSDDLTDITLDDKGPFINLIAKF